MFLLEMPCISTLFLFIFRFYMISACRHSLLYQHVDQKKKH